jgi:ribosomal subunit interface protein
MKTIVSIPHHAYPSRVRATVEAKLQHLVKFYERIVSLRAVLSREGDGHNVELVANVGHGATLVVESRREQLEAAIDEAVQRMTRVLTRHKTKRSERRRKAGRVGH